MSFLENDFFLLAVTFGIFFFAKLLQKKTGLVLLNPILLTIAAIGGIPSLTAAVVVAAGLLGAICGFKTMKIMHVGSPIAQGLSMGTAAHAVGTSTAMDISSKYGAYASLGLTLNGIFTASLTPTILRLLGVL